MPTGRRLISSSAVGRTSAGRLRFLQFHSPPLISFWRRVALWITEALYTQPCEISLNFLFDPPDAETDCFAPYFGTLGRLNHENLCNHPAADNAVCQFNYLRDPDTGQGVGQEELIQMMVTFELMQVRVDLASKLRSTAISLHTGFGD